jgi:hypothetical protein
VNGTIRDVIGKRGENIVELCLTDYANFAAPLFSTTHLGQKWPAVDFYVELTSVTGKRPFFLAQAKSTASACSRTNLQISSTKHDIERLLEIPAPTYLLGIHEPTKRVFVRAVHKGIAIKAITRIPLAYELTSQNLKALHREVIHFWGKGKHKPTGSIFS